MLFWIASTIIFIDATFGLFLWISKKLEANMLPLVFCLIGAIFSELLSYYFKIRYRNNLSVFYLYDIFEYITLGWYFYLNINYSHVRKLITITICFYTTIVLAYLYTFLHLEPLAASLQLNYFAAAQNILIVIWSLYYFKNIFDYISQYKALSIQTLIIMSAILFYYAFSAIHNLAVNILTNRYLGAGQSQSVAAISAYHQLTSTEILLALTNILLYICIFFAFFKSAIIVEKYRLRV